MRARVRCARQPPSREPLTACTCVQLRLRGLRGGADVFRMYDVNKDQFVCGEDLEEVIGLMVGANLSKEQVRAIVGDTIRKGDKDKDGKLSFEEFTAVRALRRGEGSLRSLTRARRVCVRLAQLMVQSPNLHAKLTIPFEYAK